MIGPTQKFRFDVINDYQIEQTEEPDTSGEPYSSNGATYTNHNIIGLRACETGDIVTNINLQPGDKAFLVYVVWSTGDSFIKEDSKNLTAIHLFDSQEKAAACVKAIKEHYEEWHRNEYDAWQRRTKTRKNFKKTCNVEKFDEDRVEYIGNDGATLTEAVRWIGCFESLNEVSLQEVTLLSDDTINKLKKRRFIRFI